jgi:LytS/YehU family sensor histidine kinase
MRLLRAYGWLVPVFTAVGLLFFSYHYLDDLSRRHYGTFPQRFIEEMTGAYTAMVLVPFIIWFSRRFPWPMQIFAFAVYSVVHTTLMGASRALIFPLAGLGHYDYGILWYRYPMEASHDLILYPMLIGLIYFYDRVRGAREAEVSAAKLQRELAETKLENLRLQLHPHFLFNALNAVSSVMYEDVRKADAMLAKLSGFLRIVLNSADVREITLDEELQVERMYADIMKARLEHALELSVTADPDVRLARVPALILQPLVENSIRHGMSGSVSSLHISIDAVRNGGTVEIHVRDNGAGVTPNGEGFETGGRGIANVRSRLTHLYGKDFTFRVGQLTPQGTDVCITLPFHS